MPHMVKLPDAQTLLTSAVSWSLWKQLDKVYGWLKPHSGPEAGSAMPPEPRPAELAQAVRQLADEESPLVEALAQAWVVRGDPARLEQLLAGYTRTLSYEELLVLLAVLAYAAGE